VLLLPDKTLNTGGYIKAGTEFDLDKLGRAGGSDSGKLDEWHSDKMPWKLAKALEDRKSDLQRTARSILTV